MFRDEFLVALGLWKASPGKVAIDQSGPKHEIGAFSLGSMTIRLPTRVIDFVEGIGMVGTLGDAGAGPVLLVEEA